MKILLALPQTAAITQVLQALLPRAEWVEVTSAGELSALPHKEELSLALLDTQLLGESLLPHAEALHRQSPRCNIIFVSTEQPPPEALFRCRPSGFLLPPVTAEDLRRELEELRYPPEEESPPRLHIVTFGSFIVYRAPHQPLHFTRTRSKEILAYLVDQCGYPVTSTDIARDVFEQPALGDQTSKNISKYVSLLLNDLKKAGFPDAVLKQNRSLQINRSRIDCDLYHALNGSTAALEHFHGEYMQEYSWAEATDSVTRLRTLKNPLGETLCLETKGSPPNPLPKKTELY